MHGLNSYTNASTSSEILVKIGAVTSEFKRAKIANVLQLGCNLTIVVLKQIGISQF